MSNEFKKDLESEIGRNGWGLASKILVPLLLAFTVPSAFGFIWVGSIGAEVKSIYSEQATQNSRLDRLDSSYNSSAITRAELAFAVRELSRRLDEIKLLVINNTNGRIP